MFRRNQYKYLNLYEEEGGDAKLLSERGQELQQQQQNQQNHQNQPWQRNRPTTAKRIALRAMRAVCLISSALGIVGGIHSIYQMLMPSAEDDCISLCNMMKKKM